MTTLEDTMDACVQAAVFARTHECYYCQSGYRTRMTFPEDPMEIPGSITEACDKCDGSGVSRPLPTDLAVFATGMAAAVDIMGRAREASDFGTMNAALDWAIRKLVQQQCAEVEHGGNTTMEEVYKAVSHGAALSPGPEPEQNPANALTPEELKTLLGPDFVP